MIEQLWQSTIDMMWSGHERLTIATVDSFIVINGYDVLLKRLLSLIYYGETSNCNVTRVFSDIEYSSIGAWYVCKLTIYNLRGVYSVYVPYYFEAWFTFFSVGTQKRYEQLT